MSDEAETTTRAGWVVLLRIAGAVAIAGCLVALAGFLLQSLDVIGYGESILGAGALLAVVAGIAAVLQRKA